jgi:septum formation protein
MLILASSSPRRQQILRDAGYRFVVQKADVAEIRNARETPADYVRRLAEEKARSARADVGDIVLAADTVVVTDGLILEKPADPADAERMLQQLSGGEHAVLTGICLLSTHRKVVDCASTVVKFAAMDPNEIRDYATSGEPMDKAGAYAIQGLASRYVERIDGCYFNVVGLPVSLVHRHLKTFPGWRTLIGDPINRDASPIPPPRNGILPDPGECG